MFVCQHCAVIFETLKKLSYHEKMCHDDTIEKCETCSKEVKGKQNMNHHKQSHLEIKCKVCLMLIPMNIQQNHSILVPPSKKDTL